MKERVTIKIPKELYLRLKEMVEGTGFSSVTDFIVFVLRSVAMGGDLREERLTPEEVRVIRERLKKLGYLKEER